MLEALDKIDWGAIRHREDVPSVDIPNLIRKVLNGDRQYIKADFEGGDALELLFNARGDESPQFIHYMESTPYIVPFLIEILPYTVPDYKYQILGNFAELISNRFATFWYAKEFFNCSFTENKVVWETAQAIWNGFAVYKALISDADNFVRHRAVTLLSLFYHKSTELFPFFLSSLNSETKLSNRIWLVRSAARLIACTPENREGVDARSRCANELLHVFMKDSDVSFRLEVAQAYVEVLRVNMDQSARFGIFMPMDDQITQTLLQHIEGFLKEEKPNEFIFAGLLKYLRMIGISPVVELLNRKDLRPVHAHMIVAVLLNHDFERLDRTRPLWTYHHSYEKSNFSQIFYYRNRESLFPPHIDVLRLVVNCEPFWQLPTNLFSFFYGLPDSRDELRALIEKS